MEKNTKIKLGVILGMVTCIILLFPPVFFAIFLFLPIEAFLLPPPVFFGLLIYGLYRAKKDWSRDRENIVFYMLVLMGLTLVFLSLMWLIYGPKPI
jgi:hypothetical protein